MTLPATGDDWDTLDLVIVQTLNVDSAQALEHDPDIIPRDATIGALIDEGHVGIMTDGIGDDVCDHHVDKAVRLSIDNFVVFIRAGVQAAHHRKDPAWIAL